MLMFFIWGIIFWVVVYGVLWAFLPSRALNLVWGGIMQIGSLIVRLTIIALVLLLVAAALKIPLPFLDPAQW